MWWFHFIKLQIVENGIYIYIPATAPPAFSLAISSCRPLTSPWWLVSANDNLASASERFVVSAFS